MSDATITPIITIDASVKFLTVEDRSDFYKQYELNRIQLWRNVFEAGIANFGIDISMKRANEAIHYFDKTFR